MKGLHSLQPGLKALISGWKEKGQELMQIFTQKVNPIAFELLEDKKKPASSDILYKSQKLIAELGKSFGKMDSYADSCLKSINFKVNEEDIKEAINTQIKLDWNFNEI